jgi:hypothetical protein
MLRLINRLSLGAKPTCFSNSWEWNLNMTEKCNALPTFWAHWAVRETFRFWSHWNGARLCSVRDCRWLTMHGGAVCALKLEKCINEQDVARLILQRPLSGNIGSQRFRTNKEECRARIFYSPRAKLATTWIMQRPAVCVSLSLRRLLQHKELIILLGCWSSAQQMRRISSLPFISLNPYLHHTVNCLSSLQLGTLPHFWPD